MAQPRNAAVIDQADALNGLFDEKAFSWTLAMENLETVLPGGVQVTTLEPIVDKKDGHITLHLRVVGPRDNAVDLVPQSGALPPLPSAAHHRRSRRRLQQGNPNQQLEPVSASNRFDFDLLADYNPETPAEHERSENKNAAANRSQHSEVPPETTVNQTVQAAPPANRAAPPAPRCECARFVANPTTAHRAPYLQSRSREVRNDRCLHHLARTPASPLTWHYAGFAILLVVVIATGRPPWPRLGRHQRTLHTTPLDRQIELHALEGGN